MITKIFFYTIFLFVFVCNSNAQLSENKNSFTHEDTLRGSNGAYRQKWDVLQYNITVKPNYIEKTIAGNCEMTFRDGGATIMQIDLQEPMQLDSVKDDKGNAYSFTREKNVYWLLYRDTSSTYMIIGTKKITLYYHGKPKEAKRAPWDGGWVWKKDKNNNPWMTVACQGLGASVWYPCKDIQSDKPDNGAILQVIVPDSLVAVANGRMTNKIKLGDGNTKYTWQVKNSINNYCIIPYIGKYVNFNEKYAGLKGDLDMNYWVLDYNLEKAKKQFTDAPRMMKAFEYWFGAFPFYEDGYQLVDAPHLGMEHQSAIAYGNGYKMGYAGNDLSGTGVGLKWDFIIVHESGHEWFANNICTKDIADMWVHEGFTCYSETLFTEYYYGKADANKYVIGLRKNIDNDKNIIGPYGVNTEGSGDMYYKGANMLHTIRQIVNDDEKFRAMLIEMNTVFHLKTVTTQEIENFIATKLGLNLESIFNQYLRTTNIPTLECKKDGKKFMYHWTNTVDNLLMPIKIHVGKKDKIIIPTKEWQILKVKKNLPIEKILVDENYYIKQLFEIVIVTN
jgi:aminopeptidase N